MGLIVRFNGVIDMLINIKKVALWVVPAIIGLFLMFGFLKQLLGTPSSSELSEALGPGALLVDVRSESEFAAGSVPGAINIPLDEVEASLSALEGRTPIVVFCRSGNRSAKARSILIEHGITDVVNGGAWQEVASALER